MPIGIVSDEDLQRELDRVSSTPRPKVEKVHVPELVPSITIMEKPGRSDGDVNVPDSLRQIIGEEAVINGRASALQLADMFGISPSSVSAYTAGATSTATINTPSKTILGHINKSRMRVVKKANRVLNSALEAITQDKLDYTDADKLSGIAKDMSVIIKNMEPPAQSTEDTGAQRPQFVIFAPQFRDERSFDTITVQE